MNASTNPIEALKVAVNSSLQELATLERKGREMGENDAEQLKRFEAIAYYNGLVQALAIVQPLEKLYADLEAELESEKAEYQPLAEATSSDEEYGDTVERLHLAGRISGIKYALGLIETSNGGNN